MKQITDTNKDENTTIDNNPALVIDDEVYLRGPLSMNQIETLLAYNDMNLKTPKRIAAVIECPISLIIKSKDSDEFLKNIAIKMCNSDLLTSVDYEVVGVVPDKPNTIYLKVEGFVDNIVAHKYGM